jgi:hypothetical protein
MTFLLFEADLQKARTTGAVVHFANLQPLIDLREEISPVALGPLFSTEHRQHDQVQLAVLVSLGSGDLAFRALRNDAVIDEEDGLVVTVLESRYNGSQHLHRFFVIVVVESDAEEVDASVTDRLRCGVIILLEVDPILDITGLGRRELVVRDVLDGEAQRGKVLS